MVSVLFRTKRQKGYEVFKWVGSLGAEVVGGVGGVGGVDGGSLGLPLLSLERKIQRIGTKNRIEKKCNQY